MKNKIILIMLLIFGIITSGCVTGPNTITAPGGEKVTVNEGKGPDWCKAGTKITASEQGQEGSYEIKGITTYNGTEVCEAVITSKEGTMTQYFNEKKDYMVMITRDKDGKIINKVDITNPK